MVLNLPELVAPCGMNCALCASYLALKNNVKSQGIRMPTCAGCRPRDKQCSFLKKRCPRLLGAQVNFCFECTEFPCARLKTIDKRYRDRYRMSFVENLVFIKEKGLEQFLESQEKKWKCPNCGAMVCCHNGICFSCGLEKLRTKKPMYRWEDSESNPKRL